MAAVDQAARDAAPTLKIATAVQRDRRGTGHAVLQARRALSGFRGDILALVAAAALIRAAPLRRLLSVRRADGGAAVAVLGMTLPDAGSYGRRIVSGSTLERIVEARDADEAERRVTLCNSGVLAVDSTLLFDLLAKLKPDNAKREYYLTDIVALATEAGRRCAWTEAPAEELIAVNTRAELAAAEAAMQTRLRAAAMDNGASFVDPATICLSHATVLPPNPPPGPPVIFRPGVRVADGVEIP